MEESKPPRARRRPSNRPDHIKHRRTRSGCYTCRSRRVKCGEERPICERCRKGQRDCSYPKPPASKSSSGKARAETAAATAASEQNSEDEEEDDDDEEEGDLAEDEGGETFFKASPTTDYQYENSSRGTNVHFRPPFSAASQTASGTPSLVQDSSRTPSTESSFGLATVTGSLPRSLGPKRWNMADLPEPRRKAESANWGKSAWSKYSPEIQFYLHYHETHMTHHYYCLKSNCDTFLKTTFLDIAVKHEPLLYAVVGFAAYHHTLTKPDGRIQDFLKFYNKSVSLLLDSLRKQRSSEATLLTILQLATTEEYLGHWVNLRNHQEAAYKIMMQMYTPDTVMNNEISRLILGWYARFDVFAGLLSGKSTTLGRVWFEAALQHFLRKIAIDPDDLAARMESLSSQTRLLAMDLAELMDKVPHIPTETFLHENAIMSHRIANWGAAIDPRLVNPAYAVRLHGYRQASDVIDPFEPGLLLHSHLWPMNTALIDWYGLDSLHRFQTSKILGQPAPPELEALAIKTCQMFEAMERWPGSPAGCLIASQASLSLSSLFLPKEQRYTDWARRKLAIIERNGYIYSPQFRTRMSHLWSDPSILDFWTPNPTAIDLPPIIRAIRAFVQDRQHRDKDDDDDDDTNSDSEEVVPASSTSTSTSRDAPLTSPSTNTFSTSRRQSKASAPSSPVVDPETAARERDLREMKSIFSAMQIEPTPRLMAAGTTTTTTMGLQRQQGYAIPQLTPTSLVGKVDQEALGEVQQHHQQHQHQHQQQQWVEWGGGYSVPWDAGAGAGSGEQGDVG